MFIRNAWLCYKYAPAKVCMFTYVDVYMSVCVHHVSVYCEEYANQTICAVCCGQVDVYVTTEHSWCFCYHDIWLPSSLRIYMYIYCPKCSPTIILKTWRHKSFIICIYIYIHNVHNVLVFQSILLCHLKFVLLALLPSLFIQWCVMY